ncbi:MAG TPA: hypothetical protein VIS99_13730 [Terrimicrobiaceae bacterium]
MSKSVLKRVARIALFFVLGSLPAFFLFSDIRRTAVNVPFMDDWQFIPLLEKTSQGQLTFNDLWAPHDEHRLLVPRIVIIAAMFAFNGDYRMQCCISFLAVEVISLCFLWLLIRLNGECFGVWATWFLANIALFSPIQFHNWLWPMQFAYFFPYTFLAICISALFLRIAPGWKFGLAAASALAGNYSFVHGNLIWLVALPVILFAPGILEKETRRTFAVCWIALGLLAAGLYFWGLNHNGAAPAYAYGHEGVPPTFSTLEQLRTHTGSTLIQMGLFVAGMFGNAIGRGYPVFDNLILVHRAGVMVMLLAAVVLFLAWRRDVLRGSALPWACLLIFCFLTAAFVCVGRVWRGDYQPLTMRYTTFGTFVIVSLVLLLGSIMLDGRRPFTQGSKELPVIGTINQVVYLSLGALIGIYLSIQWVGWRYGAQLMEEWEMARWRSRASLHFLGSLYVPELEYRYLGGQKEIFENGVRILEGLGMFNPPRATDLRLSRLGREAGMPDSSRRVWDKMEMRADGGWHASGFAVCCDDRPPDLILFCTQNADGEWVVRTTATPYTCAQYLRNSTRSDFEFVGSHPPQDAQLGAWEVDFPPGIFDAQEGRTVSAWALDFSRGSFYYHLEGDRELSGKQSTRQSDFDHHL